MKKELSSYKTRNWLQKPSYAKSDIECFISDFYIKKNSLKNKHNTLLLLLHSSILYVGTLTTYPLP